MIQNPKIVNNFSMVSASSATTKRNLAKRAIQKKKRAKAAILSPDVQIESDRWGMKKEIPEVRSNSQLIDAEVI